MSYIKVCPNCGSKNEEKSRFCLKCGNELSDQKLETNQTQSNSEITYSPSRTNNYKTIRAISTVLKGLALLAVVAAALSALGALGSVDELFRRNSFGGGFYLSLTGVFINIAVATILAFLSEAINVILDIEANSRQTAKTLERLLRSQG